jgi:hypothetical protein
MLIAELRPTALTNRLVPVVRPQSEATVSRVSNASLNGPDVGLNRPVIVSRVQVSRQVTGAIDVIRVH